MNKVTKLMGCLTLMLFGFSSALVAQSADSVKVTFMVNTATMPDTLQPDHTVQLRGGVVGENVAGTALPSMVTWDSGSIVTENMGGDYWKLEFHMSPGDTLNYKFWAGTDTETALNNGGEQGWESGGNRQFVLPSDYASADTTRPIHWYETREKPFTSEADSVSLYFRVNVGAFVQNQQFDPATGRVGLRGEPAVFGNPADWGTSNIIMTAEDENTENNLMYNAVVRVHKDSVASFENPVPYKYVLEDASGNVTSWDDKPGNPDNNRLVSIPAADSTIHWDYHREQAPTSSEIVETNLNFEVNVGILEGLGFFNSAIDTVFVRGTFNGWGSSDQMAFNSFSGNYDASVPYTAAVGAEEKYKYYIKWDQRRDQSSSEFYLPQISHDGSGWEEPGVTGGADRTMIITADAQQETQNEFYNGVEPQALMTESNVENGEITVTFTINMNPAKDYEADPFVPASDSVYLFVDTPFFALTNDIVVPGDGGGNFITQPAEDIEKLRFKDEDGDGVYELDLPLMLPTLNHIGFRIAYGSALDPSGELTVNGGGFDAGRRHYQYVQPIVSENLEVSWPTTYKMATIDWQRENLPWETPPDYSEVSTSNEEDGTLPEQFSLSQNYPNPFNPVTTINFNLANAADVNLSVYNVLGQKVASLINGKKMTSGQHSVQFDAANLSSGVYFYRIQAGSFVSQKSMTLIK